MEGGPKSLAQVKALSSNNAPTPVPATPPTAKKSSPQSAEAAY